MANLAVCVGALWLHDMGDLVMYKIWAHRAFYEGIHRAYTLESFRYDQLPLYLYISKLDGLVFHHLGFSELFGPWGRGLALVIKAPMIGMYLVTGGGGVCVCRHLGYSQHQRLLVAALFLLNPGLIIGTAGFGYQDALHTMLVFAMLTAILYHRPDLAAILGALVCMSKPQGIIYLFLIIPFGIWRFGWRWILRGGAVGGATVGLILSPFIIYGELGGVWEMYLGVAEVHTWLTGCAYNLWWLFWPAPPFHSDREALWLGVNGLRLGLAALAVLLVWMGYRLWRGRTPLRLLESCAFLGFGFFMLVTEIHENHLYAVFAFLAPLAAGRRFWLWIYVGLSISFAAGLIVTEWIFFTGTPDMFCGIRPSMLIAVFNTAVLLVWGGDLVRDRRGKIKHRGRVREW